MIELGIETYLRDALATLHADGTTDVANSRTVEALSPATAGRYAGP